MGENQNQNMRPSVTSILFFFIFLFGTSSPLQAQDDSYHNALGVRGGPISGITYKRFQFPPTGVLEGILGFNYANERMISLTALYEHHFFMSYRMNFYAGGGLSIAFNKNDFELPVEGIVGIEYNLETFPINFSLDYKPAYRIFDKKFVFNEFALSARFFIDSWF